jgi:hypothetical protein
MIAPPHYKCECLTLDKVRGVQKLEEALVIVEKVIKEKQGTYKIINKPQILGAKDDKDMEDIISKINEDEGAASDGSEDNDEGMGDLDIGDVDDEERKEERKTNPKKGKRKASDSDEEEDEDDDNA